VKINKKTFSEKLAKKSFSEKSQILFQEKKIQNPKKFF